ncbi:hypothetical protein BDV23DRAFT_153122 [Aspergillus alliaceus]|uniref:Uncharacterized protein n=1 Tax=Petromyces alliaceus TaxID=209559 RepID=A0A5N7CBE1_PETAA|nr:hypothetical protein BDV23DRAFT_153122 [Aspergillus alliaceus]
MAWDVFHCSVGMFQMMIVLTIAASSYILSSIYLHPVCLSRRLMIGSKVADDWRIRRTPHHSDSPTTPDPWCCRRDHWLLGHSTGAE